MILVDRPYVSGFFREMVAEHRLSVVKTPVAEALGFTEGVNLIEEAEAVRRLKFADDVRLYTTSENAIGWITRNLSFTDLPEKIALFKNKATFRTLLAPLMPDFFFKEVGWKDLDDFSLKDVPFPFVLKPAVGFFSMGVYKVPDPDAWERVKRAVEAELHQVGKLYPKEVLDTTAFIIEENVEGEEFAVDAYFDAAGAPVIVGIYRHLFGSEGDVGDRVYTTSVEVVTANLDAFSGFLERVGALTGVRNFPVHAEIRRTASGELIPIEINPMRFGGWCTTAEMTARAYGFNPYLLYLGQERPDWATALKGKEGKYYSLIVLDNSTGLDGREIADFDYDRLLARFENPLELRKIDYRRYPVFGFLFVETSGDPANVLSWVLRSDLREFVSV